MNTNEILRGVLWMGFFLSLVQFIKETFLFVIVYRLLKLVDISKYQDLFFGILNNYYSVILIMVISAGFLILTNKGDK